MARTIDNDRASVNENSDLPAELDRIYSLIHSADSTEQELCWLCAPDRIAPDIELTWLPANDIRVSPEGNVAYNVVEALRVVACDLLAAARRVEEGSR